MTHEIKPLSLDRIRSDLDDGYELGKLKRDNVLRHSRGWVSSIVDFILLGLPIIAPIPNLLNLRVALGPVLGWWASSIAAVAFELLLFGSAEIVLYLQDKHMRYGGYRWPLGIAISCGVALVAILLALIAAYEMPAHGPAVLTLPFVSVISIAFLSLKRWADMRDMLAKDRAQYDDALTVARADVARLSDDLDDAMVTIKRLETKIVAAESAKALPSISTATHSNADTETRRQQQLRLRADGVMLNKDIAQSLSENPPTISKDKKWLENQQYIDGNGRATGKGLAWIGQGDIPPTLPAPAQIHLNGNGVMHDQP